MYLNDKINFIRNLEKPDNTICPKIPDKTICPKLKKIKISSKKQIPRNEEYFNVSTPDKIAETTRKRNKVCI